MDRATARHWRAQEVAERMKASSVGESEAAQAVKRAHQTAFAVYDHATKRLRQVASTGVSSNAEDAPTVEETVKRSRGMKL